MTEASLSALLIKRGTIKRKLTMAANFVSAFQPGDNSRQAQNRIEIVKQSYTEFFECQYEIEQLETLLRKPSSAEQAEQFDTQYNKVLADLQSVIEQGPRKGDSEVAVKLPAINLPFFDGTYSKWTSFRDTFKALIEDNNNLSGVQKFHYLKSCLVKEASRVIDSLSVSEANYKAAWEALVKRFDNKRLIVQDLLNSILNYPTVTKNTHVMLRQLADTCTISISALKATGIDTTTWDPILIAILTEKIDYITRKEWQSSLTTEIPKWSEFLDFVEKRCQFLEAMFNNNKSQNQPHNKETNSSAGQTQRVHMPRYNNNLNQNKYVTNSFKATTFKPAVCIICQGPHALYHCAEFVNLTVTDRIQLVRAKGICENCLKVSHSLQDCKSKHFCKLCDKKHNSLLHPRSAKVEAESKISGDTLFARDSTDTGSSFATVHTVHENPQINNILLPTAMILTNDIDGKCHVLRALLDSASQINFITEKAAAKLKLKTHDRDIAVVGINQQAKRINKAASWKIKSRYSPFQIEISGFTIDKISEDLPQFSCSLSEFEIPQGVELADPRYFESKPIDMLIGCSIFWELIGTGRISLGYNKLILQETHLGWVVTGTMPAIKQTKFACNLATSLQNQIVKFWEVEDYGETRPLSSDEQLCEAIFSMTHRRTIEGNYLVKLPFKERFSKPLASTYQTALKRFQVLERKFERDPHYKAQYRDVIKQYLDAGHIEKIPESEIYKKENVFYLPHHGVMKPDSATTKLRVVFDASCKTQSGASLNEQLLVGPKLQQNLFAILTRFRRHKIAVTADIEKMFFQIILHPEHRDFQRFFWRSSNEGEVEMYRVKKVTFGTASAPYLAVKALQQLAIDEGDNYPCAKRIMLRDFYMDDLLTGADALDTAILLKEQLIRCCKAGGFTLRKWVSNAGQMEDKRGDDSHQYIDLIDKSNISKTLGMMWDSKADTLFYSLKLEPGDANPTKRSILSVIARLYDPLGLINPILVTAKILLQKLWIEKLNWDERIPTNIELIWQRFMKDIENINKIRIPRNVNPLSTASSWQVHAFCDASEKAYGACIYIRTAHKSNVSIQLLCAKSRVAPVKRIALPRLELCGALLLSRLLKSVINTMELPDAEIFCWTDSTIVLNWLNTPSSTLDTFVGNRVSEIQGFSRARKWRHIPSYLNPADILSRGCAATELIENTLWSNGPEFLKHNIDSWPQTEVILQTIVYSENITLSSKKSTTCLEWDAVLQKFSSFSKLIRFVAYWRKFLEFLEKKSVSNKSLTVKELEIAKQKLIKHVQKKHFLNELNSLQKGDNIPKNSRLVTLHPFIDNEGLIRVGGRLTNSYMPYHSKYPVVLPKNDFITHQIIRETHIKQLHAGPQATLAALRRNYWILCGRSIIRQVIHKCIKCFKVKPTSCSELMGNLPKERVIFTRTFYNSAVDYAGPMLIKESKGRGKRTIKAYIALFICLATKAIHLELVTDCAAESFVNALKRFISRRGKPATLLSDNATTFKGADQDLKKAMCSQNWRQFTSCKLAEDGIQWKFIPPRSPHFGGIYEAGIKSIKYHLKRVVGQALLTYEEMYTMLTMIEACVNSRPITPLPDSPAELEALTPGHFLIGSALTTPPEPDVQEIRENRLSRWQRVEQLRQHFWRRWQREYVVQLQQRMKWNATSSKQLQAGDMVILQEDNLPPLLWALGRVVHLHPGRDGRTRVVTVKTRNGTIKRAVHRLCALPI